MRRAIVQITVAIVLPALPAAAHDWYPSSCCSGRDCQPIESSEVQVTPDGWRIAMTGEVIPYGDAREQYSPDGEFHRCSRNFADPRHRDSTICLFVPNTAS